MKSYPANQAGFYANIGLLSVSTSEQSACSVMDSAVASGAICAGSIPARRITMPAESNLKGVWGKGSPMYLG